MSTKAIEEDSGKEVEMIKVSAVKMGCNKCIAVFYSQGAYHDHLSTRHRIKNYDKYPPTIISKLSKKIPAIPKMSEEEEAERPYHCSGCTSKFFTTDALHTHETLCYKASIEVKESQAKIMYECLAEEEKEKGDVEKKDTDGVQRESRSRIPKKKESTSRKERGKGSKSKSEERRSRSKSCESKAALPDAEISENEKKSEICDSQNADKDESVKRKGNLKSKEDYEMKEDKGKEMSISDTTKKEQDPKTFNKKPPPKRYPLRNNKEVEEAKEILNKYKTINQGKEQEMKESETAESIDTTVEQVDNTDLDADYSPEQGNNSTSISFIETPKLPKKVRRQTRSMKNSEDTETKEDKKSATNKVTDEAKRKNRRQMEPKEDKEHPKSKKTKQPTKSEPASENEELAEISDDKSKDSEVAEIPDIPKNAKTVKKNSKKASTKSQPVRNEAKESEEENYKCNICDKVFISSDAYNLHKKNCTKVPKKHVCSKCGKGFTERTYLICHYDYQHTDKPKKFQCTPCKRSFELEKTFKEHNQTLHNKGDLIYLCDFCSRKFWHRQEFTLHRAQHTGDKPYQCGRCGIASFADPNRLKNHLKTCGQENKFKCNPCGGMYSDQKSLATHVSDHHEKKERPCPICPNKIYTSEGGYYTHMRIAHKIRRNGKKLSEVVDDKEPENQNNTEEENKGEISDSQNKPIPKKQRKGIHLRAPSINQMMKAKVRSQRKRSQRWKMHRMRRDLNQFQLPRKLHQHPKAVKQKQLPRK